MSCEVKLLLENRAHGARYMNCIAEASSITRYVDQTPRYCVNAADDCASSDDAPAITIFPFSSTTA